MENYYYHSVVEEKEGIEKLLTVISHGNILSKNMQIRAGLTVKKNLHSFNGPDFISLSQNRSDSLYNTNFNKYVPKNCTFVLRGDLSEYCKFRVAEHVVSNDEVQVKDKISLKHAVALLYPYEYKMEQNEKLKDRYELEIETIRNHLKKMGLAIEVITSLNALEILNSHKI